MMRQTLIVGAGGFLGSVLRFQLSLLLQKLAAGWSFPVWTVAVNLTGCLAAGAAAGLFARHGSVPGDARLFVLVGVLGGYTTFSAFSLETALLLQRGLLGAAAANVLVSVLAGLAALWAGLKLAS